MNPVIQRERPTNLLPAEDLLKLAVNHRRAESDIAQDSAKVEALRMAIRDSNQQREMLCEQLVDQATLQDRTLYIRVNGEPTEGTFVLVVSPKTESSSGFVSLEPLIN